MKRLIILIATLFFVAAISNEAAATLRFKVKPVQLYYHSGGYGADYSVGLAFEGAGEHGRFGMQHNIDLDFNEINPLLRYKADFKIYLLDDAPSGLYIAPYFTIGATTDGYDSPFGDGRYTLIAYGAGGAVGYQYMFGDDRFSIEAQFAIGMSGMYFINDPGETETIKNNDIGFGMIPHLGFGFHFD